MSSSSSSDSSFSSALAAGAAEAAAAAGAAEALAAANLLGSLMNSLTVSASLNSTSVTAAMASRLRKPLAMLCGTEASVGYPIDSETAARLATPAWNLARRSSGLMSRISGEKIEPESNTC
uniref:Uncharacterized protein n=3 Tax=Nyssorhynchus TaxID=44543 RepID=A0A2M3ZL71_9DIPT